MRQTSQDISGTPVLAIFAHPDDEGFSSGGALAMLVARGARITLVCATNGDVGQISDPALATKETLAQIRQQELLAAMAVTGISDVRFLNYRDSGMQGSRHNNHPASLLQAEPAYVVQRLVGIIRELQPTMIITHDPAGIYGHPDHIAVYRHATEAFSQAGSPIPLSPPRPISPFRKGGSRGISRSPTNPEQPPIDLQPWSPHLLYYSCAPKSSFRRMWQQMLEADITPPFASKSVDTLGCPDEDVTTILDVSQFVDTKLASLECHRTQMDPNSAFAKLPPEQWRSFMSTEYYILAVPKGASKSEDLLAHLP